MVDPYEMVVVVLLDMDSGLHITRTISYKYKFISPFVLITCIMSWQSRAGQNQLSEI